MRVGHRLARDLFELLSCVCSEMMGSLAFSGLEVGEDDLVARHGLRTLDKTRYHFVILKG